MPFIAIALAVSLFLGGSAVVATNTDAGAHAVHTVSHAWNHFKADVEEKFEGGANADANANAEASSTTNANVDLNTNINADVDVAI